MKSFHILVGPYRGLILSIRYRTPIVADFKTEDFSRNYSFWIKGVVQLSMRSRLLAAAFAALLVESRGAFICRGDGHGVVSTSCDCDVAVGRTL